MAIVNETSYHGNITHVLNIIFVTKEKEKNCFFIFF